LAATNIPESSIFMTCSDITLVSLASHLYPGSVPKNEIKLSMGRIKWFDRFLTNEIVAQNRFLTRRRRYNRFLRPIKEITSTMGLSPEPIFNKPSDL